MEAAATMATMKEASRLISFDAAPGQQPIKKEAATNRILVLCIKDQTARPSKEASFLYKSHSHANDNGSARENNDCSSTEGKKRRRKKMRRYAATRLTADLFQKLTKSDGTCPMMRTLTDSHHYDESIDRVRSFIRPKSQPQSNKLSHNQSCCNCSRCCCCYSCQSTPQTTTSTFSPPTTSFASLVCVAFILLTLAEFAPVANCVDCFKCSSRNGSNPACEDPFHNLNSTRITSPIVPDPTPNVIYHTPCYAGKKGREGLFPASACIKLTGTFDNTGETLVVRHCALDSGTLTQDTELARMSHCGKFQFEGDLLKGCVLACPEDACNSSESDFAQIMSHSNKWLAICGSLVIYQIVVSLSNSLRLLSSQHNSMMAITGSLTSYYKFYFDNKR